MITISRSSITTIIITIIISSSSSSSSHPTFLVTRVVTYSTYCCRRITVHKGPHCLTQGSCAFYHISAKHLLIDGKNRVDWQKQNGLTVVQYLQLGSCRGHCGPPLTLRCLYQRRSGRAEERAVIEPSHCLQYMTWQAFWECKPRGGRFNAGEMTGKYYQSQYTI